MPVIGPEPQSCTGHFLIVKSNARHWDELSALFTCVFSKMLGALGTLTEVTLLIPLDEIQIQDHRVRPGTSSWQPLLRPDA